MFGYASALVELGYFDAIDINFLIVGHTHSSIDQYFSVLSKAIKKAEFIGSPISLQALCNQAHKDRARPAVNRQIEVYYNVVDALKPYINNKIHFYQVPHCYVFRRLGNKCIMQYKLFSTHVSWLPLQPELSKTIQNSSSTTSSSSTSTTTDKLLDSISAEVNRISSIALEPLSTMDGKDAFLKHIGISGEAKSSYLINNPAMRNKIDVIDAVLPIIEETELLALRNLETRTNAEVLEGHVKEHKELLTVKLPEQDRLVIQTAMKSVSSNRKGYIMWILDKPGLPPLSELVPKLIHTGSSISLSASQKVDYQNLIAAQQNSACISDTLANDTRVELQQPSADDEVEFVPTQNDESLFDRTTKSSLQRAKDIVAVAKKALENIHSIKNGVNVAYTYHATKEIFDGNHHQL